MHCHQNTDYTLEKSLTFKANRCRRDTSNFWCWLALSTSSGGTSSQFAVSCWVSPAFLLHLHQGIDGGGMWDSAPGSVATESRATSKLCYFASHVLARVLLNALLSPVLSMYTSISSFGREEGCSGASLKCCDSDLQIEGVIHHPAGQGGCNSRVQI